MGKHVSFLSFTLSLSFILPMLLFVSVSQMNRPIQVKPADSESRGGTVSLPFLPSSLPLSLPSFVPTLQTCCLCTSASPLCVPFDEPCTSTRADSAAWPCPPVRTHYVNGDLPGWRPIRFLCLFVCCCFFPFRGVLICLSRSHACAHVREAFVFVTVHLQ